MTPIRSLFRAAALTGAAAFLFSLAHVSPAGAQTSTRHIASCQATSQQGTSSATCNVFVPYGKVFIVESALFGGYTWGRVQVRISTKQGNDSYWHFIPPGNFQPGDFTTTHWTAALPGPIFSEGNITLQVSKPYDSYLAWIRVTMSGRLEDI
jgi:hypothetical protein